ncbi:hypothetical protein [Streptomyces sp. NPDC057582]|uniref:hypothetical protein n=1 Tax=Streptomyces sp. NPDC057582 TaxID=3346174 RepID=UPI00369A1A52
MLVRTDFGEWERFDCGVGEFMVGLLTDVRFGFPTSRIAAHCFLSQAPTGREARLIPTGSVAHARDDPVREKESP